MAVDHLRDDPPSAVPGCAAAIIFAVAIEADAFARQATGPREFRAGGLTFHEGMVAGRRVAWCVAGIGGGPAARVAQLLVDGHRPRVLVSAGFAGGLDPALARGSVARASRVVAADGGRPFPLGDHAAASPLTIVTVDRVVRTAVAKRELAAQCGAHLVDMETHAVADVAAANGLSCLSVRVISDDAAHELPAEITRLAAPQSPLRRLGAAVGAIGRRPSAAVDLWRLWEHAVVDGRTLAAALVESIAALPDDS